MNPEPFAESGPPCNCATYGHARFCSIHTQEDYDAAELTRERPDSAEIDAGLTTDQEREALQRCCGDLRYVNLPKLYVEVERMIAKRTRPPTTRAEWDYLHLRIATAISNQLGEGWDDEFADDIADDVIQIIKPMMTTVTPRGASS